MLRVLGPPRASMSEEELVRDANARMEKYAAKWLAHPAVKVVVHRKDVDRERDRKIAL